MKKIMLALLTTSSVFGDVIQMSPLCEEVPRILHCRMLFLEEDIMDLESEVECEKNNIQDLNYRRMKFFISRMKYNIGFPVEIKDMEFPHE